MSGIATEHWDLAALAAGYRAARPFAHVVLDGFVDDATLGSLLAAFEDEPARELQDEIFHVMASGQAFEQDAFRRQRARLEAPGVLAAMRAITGEEVTGVEARAYAYLPGHYLLPHADQDAGARRRIAWAHYVELLEGTSGGELDLYTCSVEGGAIVETLVGATIEPRRNRCVLFEVSDRSLHQVREVTSGGRLSLAGWFVR